MESTLQSACIKWFNEHHRHHAFCVHVPNARKQTPTEGARWRALGVVAGWPDLMVVSGGKILLVELKTKEGRTNKAQDVVHARLKEQGTEVHVVRELVDFKRLVDNWLELPSL